MKKKKNFGVDKDTETDYTKDNNYPEDGIDTEEEKYSGINNKSKGDIDSEEEKEKEELLVDNNNNNISNNDKDKDGVGKFIGKDSNGKEKKERGKDGKLNPFGKRVSPEISLSNGKKVRLGTPWSTFYRLLRGIPKKEFIRVHKLWKIYRAGIYKRVNRPGFHVEKSKKGDDIWVYRYAESPIKERKEDVKELFGRMFTLSEVFRIINDDWSIRYSYQSLIKFRKRYFTEINQRIEEHKRTYSDMRMAIKKSRLEELSWLYGDMKEKYKATQRVNEYRSLLFTLEQIRKEVEGDRLVIDGVIDANIDIRIQQHIRENVIKQFPVQSYILGIVASRMSLPVEQLIKQLSDNYYSRFDKNELANEETIFPSDKDYDFEKIRLLNEGKKVEVAEAEVMNEEEKIKLGDKKELLKARVREKLKALVEKRKDLEETVDKFDSNRPLTGQGSKKNSEKIVSTIDSRNEGKRSVKYKKLQEKIEREKKRFEEEQKRKK